MKQILTELFAQVHINIAKCAMTFDKVMEMLIDELPLLVFVPTHLFEVGKEVGLLLGLIQEAELFIDEGLYPDTADGLRLVQHVVVELSFHLVLGMSIDVNTEVLPAAHLHGFRVTDCRIIIQMRLESVRFH